MKLALTLILTAFLIPAGARAPQGKSETNRDKDKYQDADEVAILSFVVIKDYNGKPVRNAGIVMHPVAKNDRQEKGGIELKSDLEGKASFDGVPYGKLRVQVLATGFQSYGEDFDIEQPKVEITVRLKRPQGQYSIYGDQPPDKDKKEDAKPVPDAKPQ
jgi:hypothetical protein